jgi:two-component system phosphate regulon response regulator PhoB/two-component system alkaline phosphatase synthesis response regulator PhoP
MARILVVDDEPDIIRIVTKILEGLGHAVRTAGDGQDALAEVAKEAPDVLILDLNLPKVDGFEVCRRLKSDAATKAIPILMMTAAYVSVDDAKRGENVGADEYIVKPFLRDILVHNVERLLRPKA